MMLSSRADRLRWLLPAVAAACSVWAALVVVTGGVVIRTSFLRVSSREPVRPLAAAAVALVVYVALFRSRLRGDMARVAAAPWPALLGGGCAMAALVIGVSSGSKVAAGSDASGYVSEADRWVHGTLVYTAPEWARQAHWENAIWTSAPLGYRPLGREDKLVPTYSPGLPMVMSMFQQAGGRDAVYLVVPLFGAAAVLATYLLGVRLAGPWAGLAASALMVSSPTFLQFLVQPLSDVPTAALWAIALSAAAGTSSSSVAIAGAASGLAILIRPNLAPLSAVIGLVLLTRPSWRVRDVALFVVPVAIGSGVIAVLNESWYGSPFRSGYGTAAALYDRGRVWPNLQHYARWWVDAETPIALLALAAPAIVASTGRDRRVLFLMLLFAAAVVAFYLPYFEFEVWWYLRFLLPAFPPLFACSAAVMAMVVRRSRHRRLAGTLAAGIIAAVAVHGIQRSEAFGVARADQRYRDLAEYVTRLPPRSVLVSLVHSGSIQYYAGRDVLRWELLGPPDLDGAVAFLRQRGHEVYLAGDAAEVPDFKARFAGSRTLQDLDRGREAVRGTTVVYPLAGSAPPP